MLRSTCAVSALLLSLACHPNRPVIDAGPRPDVDGSISGMVTASDSTGLIARKVVAVDVETGAQFDESTTATGGYTMRVPPGTYRLGVELRAGETLAAAPEATEVDRAISTRAGISSCQRCAAVNDRVSRTQSRIATKSTKNTKPKN